MSDKRVRKYFENMPYGQDSKSSEIHGKRNQLTINKYIASLVRKYDEHIANGDKETAAHFSNAIKDMSLQLDNLKGIKEEFALNYGGGTGDITENWVIKGTGESDFMTRQQSAVKQSNSIGEPLDFDIDWEVNKMLENEDAWKSFVSDKIGGRYFLNDYIEENEQAIRSGEISDEMLHPDSFNPDFDNRLHEYYANRLRKAFDTNHQTPAEARKADELIAKTNIENTES